MSGAAQGGWLVIAGLGPGDWRLVTPEVEEALTEATDIIGYIPYVARVPDRAGLVKHASDNRVEIDRARHALELAAKGRRVVVVSSGDPGVFAMASAVFEALEAGPEAWRALDLRVLPGITALAVEGDFAMAFYNPRSKSRPEGFARTLELLNETCGDRRPVIFARAVSTPDEELRVVPLPECTPEMADMRTVVIVGSSRTRIIARDKAGGRGPIVYTPRSVPV